MTKSILVFCVSLLSFPILAAADDVPAQPKELTDLQLMYESKVQQAIQPIKDHYIDDLKALLRTEMDKGDAEAVVAVKAELTKIETDGAHTPDTSLFSGSKWKSDEGGTIVFETNGKWSESWKGNSNEGSWKSDRNPMKVVVTRSDSQVFHFQINASGEVQRDVGAIVYRRIGE